MIELNRLTRKIGQSYQPEDYPCIECVERLFMDNPAIFGQRVLFAIPLFINTLPALLPWLRAGADVTVSWPKDIAADERAVELLKNCGVDCRADISPKESFDVILDCTGDHSDNPSRCGYVELTRSGATKYEKRSDLTCIDVDASSVKELETFFGTADGLIRALDKMDLGQLQDKPCLLFGFGKVGRGVAKGLLQRGANLTVVEYPDRFVSGHSCGFIDCREEEAVQDAVRKSHLVVTATGVKGVITNNYSPKGFIHSDAILINMGAEDEYGSGIPDERVENQRMPVNFILDEPTRMKFIDPTMALYSLSGALLLDPTLAGTFAPGKHLPPESFTSGILECFYSNHHFSPDAMRAGDVL